MFSEVNKKQFKCPGMSPSSWKPKDISYKKCINDKCIYQIEFWKDDILLACPKCGTLNPNPKINNVCLAWCEKAKECLGDKNFEEWRTEKYDANEMKRFAEMKHQIRLR